MTTWEQRWAWVLGPVVEGRLSIEEAAAQLGLPPADHPWRRVRRDSALGQRRLTESLNR